MSPEMAPLKATEYSVPIGSPVGEGSCSTKAAVDDEGPAAAPPCMGEAMPRRAADDAPTSPLAEYPSTSSVIVLPKTSVFVRFCENGTIGTGLPSPLAVVGEQPRPQFCWI